MQLGLTVVSLLDGFRGSRFSRLFTHMLMMLAGAFGVACGELDCARIFHLGRRGSSHLGLCCCLR